MLFLGANCSSPKSKKKGKLSILDNMLKLHAGNKPVNRTHSKRNQVLESKTSIVTNICKQLIFKYITTI